MTFWEQFLVEFCGGIASGVVLVLIGYLTRHKIVRTVRRSIRKIESIESGNPAEKR